MKNLIDKINKSKYIGIILVFIATIITSLFLFHKGIILGHDLEYHLSRIESIADLIKIGDFKALIHEGVNGYGYANGMCYSNLFLYLPALLVLMGIKTVTSYKIYLFLISLVTGLVMYFCVNKISKSRFASTISSILYVLCSYRLCDLMVRAALGETLSFIFIPVIILGLYYLIYDDYKKFWIFSIGFVGLINCHLISTVIMVGVSLLFMVLNYERIFNEPKRILYFIYSAILGMLLGAFFILPMLEFYVRNNIIIKNYSGQDMLWMHFHQTLCGIPKFTTRFIAPGIGLIFVYFVFNYIYVTVKDEKKDLLSFTSACNITGIICLFLSSSFLPWDELAKVVGFVQFTWRLFVPVCAFLAFVAGIYFEKYLSYRKYKNLIVIVVIGFIFAASLVYQVCSVKSLETYYKGDEAPYIEELDEFTMASGEYLLMETDWSLLDLDIRVPMSNNYDMDVTFEDLGSILNIKFENNYKEGTYIEIPQIYYKGYAAKNVDTGKYYKLSMGYNTWIRIDLDNDTSGNIKLYYRGTTVLRVSYLVSLISWILFISWKVVGDKNGKR